MAKRKAKSPKAKKGSTSLRSKKPGKGLFDLLKCITTNKTKWEDLTDPDRANFSVFMINRFLSMNPDYIDIVNDLQKYTNGILKPKQVYEFYYDVLPSGRYWSKYIKKEGATVNKELIDIIKTHYEFSGREAEDYITWYKRSPGGTDILTNIMREHGVDDKTQKKLLK